MDQSNIYQYFQDLSTKYLSGNASDAEVTELENWVLADPKNKEQFKASKKAWMLAGMNNKTAVNTNKAWKETSDQVFNQSKVVPLKSTQNRRRWLAIAASIALLAVAGIWMFRNNNTAQPLFVETTTNAQIIDLSDGSQVTLNQSSKLTYTPAGKEAQRKVNLQGDAFFEVARDESKPFIIQTQDVEIEVLGTSFYVDARPNQSEIQVIVKSGKVAVRSGATEQILTANEKAVFQKNTQALTKTNNKDANYLSLKNKNLIFENSTFEELVFSLNRHFNTTITIKEEALKTCAHSGIYKNKSLETILKILESTHPIQANKNGQKIVLEGSCK